MCCDTNTKVDDSHAISSSQPFLDSLGKLYEPSLQLKLAPTHTGSYAGLYWCAFQLLIILLVYIQIIFSLYHFQPQAVVVHHWTNYTYYWRKFQIPLKP